MEPLITSTLWDDLYKFTVGQAIFRLFPNAKARYVLQDRQPERPYPADMNHRVLEQIEYLSDVVMTKKEFEYMQGIRFFSPTYLDWRKHFQYDPKEVKVYFDKPVNRGTYNEIGTIEGPWYRVSQWEVKLMLLTSACRNYGMQKRPHWRETIKEKYDNLAKNKVSWIDYGTRRAFDAQNAMDTSTQDEAVRMGRQYAPYFRGTSNMFLAMKHGLTAQGTIGHEWYMAMQALYSFEQSNLKAMEHWIEVYDGDLGIVLPDTLTSDVFIRSFGRKHAKLWDGVRLDSGDPFEDAMRFVNKVYRPFGIDPESKVFVPSDSLTDVKAVEFRNKLVNEIGSNAKITAGIGTFIVNDCGYEPSKIVCKLDSIDFGFGWVPVVKTSNDLGKMSGNKNRLDLAQQILRLSVT